MDLNDDMEYILEEPAFHALDDQAPSSPSLLNSYSLGLTQSTLFGDTSLLHNSKRKASMVDVIRLYYTIQKEKPQWLM